MHDDIMTIVLAVIGTGVLNTTVSQLLSSYQNKKNSKNASSQALRLLMKDRLRFLCDHYITQGWIYDDELEDLIVMHNCYHNDLNGNGYLDELMSRVKSLEIRGIGVK